MTWWKIAIVWWLVDALWQTWTMIRLRQRYGGYVTEVVTRAVLGRLWLLKTAISSFFWPIGMWTVYVRKAYPLDDNQALNLVNAAKHLSSRCPDCGESLELHTEHLANDYKRKSPPQ